MIKLESKIIRVVLYIYMQAFQTAQHRRKKAAEFSIAAFYIAAARAPQKNYSQYAAKQKIMNILRTTGRGLLTVQPGGGFLHRSTG